MASAGNKIDVERKGFPLMPFSFVFKKKKHEIGVILHQWQEYGFDTNDKKRDWSTRRRRNYFHVETKSGEAFEIYQDMSDHKSQSWFLTREIVDEKA